MINNRETLDDYLKADAKLYSKQNSGLFKKIKPQIRNL